ncbi:hypothetical protein [Nucisporomicrobium flavum]|jgi:hypothetical protein|uniref:hypothetical protein n=1 Tax=Nucisporomicrobium flavum TaxID=2785915 RepID=UPI0018F529E3|nr:hypothetical protein [Nucisporomicrobium flavum]
MTVGGGESVDWDWVLWAKVRLLSTHPLSPVEAAKAYRILNRVEPRWYGVRLATTLTSMAVRDCEGKPAARAALMAESYLAARGADEGEPERYYLMVISLEWRGKALAELGRAAEEEIVGAELVAVARKAIGTRPRTGEWHGVAIGRPPLVDQSHVL